MSYKLKRFKSRRALVAILGAAALLASLSAAPAAWSHPSATPARLLVKVHARIKLYGNPDSRPSPFAPRAVFFTPSLINVGTVIILISNSDDDHHQFEINGVTSRWMGPGGKAVMRVTFKRPGSYGIAVSGYDGVEISGTLKVVK